jgi:heme-degrading monooxygenase HmoA
MTYALIIHKVQDYATWKQIYDEDGPNRKVKGSKGATVLRNTNDHNHLVVITEWENIDKAKNFVESDDLRITMQKARVVGRPAVFYLEEIEKTKF